MCLVCPGRLKQQEENAVILYVGPLQEKTEGVTGEHGGVESDPRTGLLAVIALLTTSLTLCGCSFTATARVTVHLPELPHHWVPLAEDMQYECVYPDSDGSFASSTISSSRSSLEITIPKGDNIPILLYPLIEGVRLRPAGALIPLHCRGGSEVTPTWKQGFAAALIKRLYYSSSTTEVINTARLIEEIEEETDNPWTLDMQAMEEGFRYAAFNHFLIDTLPVYDVTLAAGKGTWISDNPFVQGYVVEGRAGLALREISTGVHHFFSADRQERIDLCITGQGWFMINPDRGNRESGTW